MSFNEVISKIVFDFGSLWGMLYMLIMLICKIKFRFCFEVTTCSKSLKAHRGPSAAALKTDLFRVALHQIDYQVFDNLFGLHQIDYQVLTIY